MNSKDMRHGAEVMMKERDFDIMLNACKQRQQFYKYVSELVKYS